MTPLERFDSYMTEQYGQNWFVEKSNDFIWDAKRAFFYGCLLAWDECFTRIIRDHPAPQAFRDFNNELKYFIEHETEHRREKEAAMRAAPSTNLSAV